MPVLAHPKDNILLNGYRIPFEWSEADGEKYQLEVWTRDPVIPRRVFNKEYTGMKVCGDGVCRSLAKKQLRGGEYTWRMRVEKGGIWGEWTGDEEFSVVNPVPELKEPLLEVFTAQPAFQWSGYWG